MSNSIPEDLNDAILKLLRAHRLTCAQFTETQLAEVIRQALLTGDFVRYTLGHFPNEKEAIVYIPFRLNEGLTRQLEKYREALEWYQNYIPADRAITPESAAYEREFGIGRVANEVLK